MSHTDPISSLLKNRSKEVECLENQITSLKNKMEIANSLHSEELNFKDYLIGEYKKTISSLSEIVKHQTEECVRLRGYLYDNVDLRIKLGELDYELVFNRTQHQLTKNSLEHVEAAADSYSSQIDRYKALLATYTAGSGEGLKMLKDHKEPKENDANNPILVSPFKQNRKSRTSLSPNKSTSIMRRAKALKNSPIQTKLTPNKRKREEKPEPEEKPNKAAKLQNVVDAKRKMEADGSSESEGDKDVVFNNKRPKMRLKSQNELEDLEDIDSTDSNKSKSIERLGHYLYRTPTVSTQLKKAQSNMLKNKFTL
ncbi:hypothetical protein AKO1_007346 [Acrasis kona]|uniref:Uncharacterized protein n=1 Tax=Acrasis kona TaxID=1008807 RepID=A0AAW2YS17_9EUKA